MCDFCQGTYKKSDEKILPAELILSTYPKYISLQMLTSIFQHCIDILEEAVCPKMSHFFFFFEHERVLRKNTCSVSGCETTENSRFRNPSLFPFSIDTQVWRVQRTKHLICPRLSCGPTPAWLGFLIRMAIKRLKRTTRPLVRSYLILFTTSKKCFRAESQGYSGATNVEQRSAFWF